MRTGCQNSIAALTCLMSLTLCGSSLLHGEEVSPTETTVAGRVESVALFKNGLSIVRLEVPISGPGIYRLSQTPEPVHGTFLVQSSGTIEARMERRVTTEEHPSRMGFSLQDELAGLKVTIHTRSAKTPLVGTVVAINKTRPDAESAGNRDWPPGGQEPGSRFLLLRTDTGVTYVDLNEIAAVDVSGQPQPILRQENRPTLLLVAGADTVAGSCRISYLAHGISWAPDYHVELQSPDRLKLVQHAVIRNELLDLNDTKVSVISGYPSVQFSNVVSPLSASQTWQSFFQQLGSHGRETPLSNGILVQNIAYNSQRGSDETSSVAPNLGDAIDLHYQPIGRRTLKLGDAFATTTGTAETGYNRIVEWTIPDNRDEWGNPAEGRSVDPASGEQLREDVWDAIRFRNPLPFPMTSAPVMVTTGETFSGQSQVLWTDTGEEATVRVNKALSIRAVHVEYEKQSDERGESDRELINIGGRRFRRVTVNGELRLGNHRAIEAPLIIKRQFTGDFVKGDASPKIDLREEGVWSINRRNELTWSIRLKPAEERIVSYQYTVLVPF